MPELKYKFTYDTLFKMLFTARRDILKRLVAAAIGISWESITEFEVTNPDIPPDSLGDKFCRLDINMLVDGARVNLEVQVADEGDYPERTLYYWAREYSSALKSGVYYIDLPRVVIMSIVDFPLFDCEEYHSEFRPFEVKRGELLSDRMVLHYFEVRKLPKDVDKENELQLLRSLFRAKTEEELKQLEALEVSIVKQAIGEYRKIVVSPEFRELERLRREALSNEAAALRHARQVEAQKWQRALADKDAALANKDAALAEQAARIAELEARLGQGKS